jgi:hypothetical protein
MKIKALLGSIAAVIVLALIAGGAWWELRPQVITLDDDSKVTLVKVDYDKRHEVDSPTKHTFSTTNDALVVWVHQQYDSKEYHYFQYYIYDQANTACVLGMQGMGTISRRGNEVVPIQFPAFPRGDSKFNIVIQENSNDGQDVADQKFSVSNPARSSSDSWAAQPLPDTEEDGDLSVTLKKLVADSKMSFNRGGDDDDPINRGVQATFSAQMGGTNADNWQPVAVSTTDATGNRVDAMSVNSQPQSDDLLTTFQYGLWPNVPAWKLRVEFSKQSGFNDSELWSVPNLPLQDGRQRDFFGGRTRGKKPSQPQPVAAASAETDLQGFHLTISPPKHFTDVPANSQPQGGLVIQITPALPDGMRLTLVKLTDDQGNDITHWDYGNNSGRNGGQYRYGLQNVDGVTNINVTLALHKSHYVEFTAKPEIAPQDTSDQSN